jgi:hypothetical protein
MNTYFAVILLFSISMTLYLLGFNSAFFELMDKYGGLNIDSMPAMMADYIFKWGGWLTVGLAVTVGALLSGLNFIALIPLALGYIMVDLMTFPAELIDILPSPLNFLLTIFFRLLQFILFISFVRSGN